MFDYRGLQDVLFIALYWGVAFLAVLAAVYLLFRRRNVFMRERGPECMTIESPREPVRIGHPLHSSLRLRRWTAVLMLTMAASHVWWYAIGQWWLADDSLWPWLVAQLPVVMLADAGMNGRSWYYGYKLPHYYQLLVVAAFVVYYIFALRQYGRWLRDNYADLEHKEVWQSLTFVVVLFVIYAVYTSNMGEMAREYLSQVISIVIIAFLLWRVETLEELPSEEDMDNGSLRSK